MIVAGALSGTSLDGIDVAVVDIVPKGKRYAIELLHFSTEPLASELRARLLAAFPPAPLDALTLSALHADVGDAFGEAVVHAADGIALDLVASHGITIAHAGSVHQTLQIGDASRIRERTGVTVAYDFRAADCAAGGEGAPLVPYLDAMLFGSPTETRVSLNLGGIANLTVLPAGAVAQDVIAFDSGPANLPIDTYVALRSNGARLRDDGGALALRGRCNDRLLAQLLDDAYFSAAPPKSTGREQYGAPFIARYRAQLDALTEEDALATLTALTVRTVTSAIRTYAPEAVTAIVGGGGVHNAALMAGLRRELPAVALRRTDDFGVNADAKEAILFAVLGVELLRGRPANMPKVTGARGPRVLGSLVPHELEALLAAVRREEKP
jgi:anhydro-N-acetylmuramic acid kinase